MQIVRDSSNCGLGAKSRSTWPWEIHRERHLCAAKPLVKFPTGPKDTKYSTSKTTKASAGFKRHKLQVRSSQIKSDQVSHPTVDASCTNPEHYQLKHWFILFHCRSLNVEQSNFAVGRQSASSVKLFGPRKSNFWMLSLQSDRKVKSASFRPGTAPSDKNTP